MGRGVMAIGEEPGELEGWDDYAELCAVEPLAPQQRAPGYYQPNLRAPSPGQALPGPPALGAPVQHLGLPPRPPGGLRGRRDVGLDDRQASFERAKSTPYSRKAYGDVQWLPPKNIPPAMQVREGRSQDHYVYCRLISPRMQFHARVRRVCAYCAGRHFLVDCTAMKEELKFGEDWFLFPRTAVLK